MYWQRILIPFVNSAYGMCVWWGRGWWWIILTSKWKWLGQEELIRTEAGRQAGRERRGGGSKEGREGMERRRKGERKKMKGGKKGERENGNSLFHYLILESTHLYFVDVDFSTQSKQDDYTHILYRLPSSVLKSLFYFLRWDISWPLFMGY